MSDDLLKAVKQNPFEACFIILQKIATEYDTGLYYEEKGDYGKARATAS